VNSDKLILDISGHDFLDGTPVLDIKPYIHYADSREQSSVAWLGDSKISKQKIIFKHNNLRQVIK
jgi:tRNA (Thr-GGU) A37 N-methylase